jgi:nucleoside-diphosphate-sugar epimerase
LGLSVRVLVTGAAGFIGSHVVEALAGKGDEIFAMTRNISSVERRQRRPGEIHMVELDLMNLAAVRSALQDIRPELTIHLAWCTQPGEYWSAPENLDYVEASLQLARGLCDVACRKLVVAGSCAEYDWDYGFLSEDRTPLRPRTLYGACKNGLREILQAYCCKKAMQFAWLRFFHLYGPREKESRLVPSMILSLLRGETARCTGGEHIRDFLHVEDAASAVRAVGTSDFTGAINIGSGEPVKLKTIVEMIAAILDARDRAVFAALPDKPSEPHLLVADVRKLACGVGWRASRDLAKGLRDTVIWWKSQIADRQQEGSSDRHIRGTSSRASGQIQ